MNSTKFWDKAAAKYAKSPISDMSGYLETLERIRTVLQPHHRVLEIGCGTGSTALELAADVDQYTATDVSSKMIAIAKSKQNADTPKNLRFETQEAEKLAKGSHDVVLALNLLHLLPNLEEVLTQIHDELPVGGLFVSKTALLKDGAWYLRPMISVMRLFGKAPYVRMLGNAELKDILKSTGFDVTETLNQGGVAPRLFIVCQKT
jgi:predicted TPR repeat methyltransferase